MNEGTAGIPLLSVIHMGTGFFWLDSLIATSGRRHINVSIG